MGGDILLQSRVGEGSQFSFTIPVNVEDYSDVVISDLLEFKHHSFALMKETGSSHKLDALKYYLSTCNINVQIIDQITHQFDLLFIEENSLDINKINTLEREQIPSIVIMDYYNESYDDYRYITPICFPIYASKLQRVLHKALEIKKESDADNKKNQQLKYKGHLLVAEDNEANQEFIKIILERYGFSYKIVENGEDAVTQFMKHSYDMVLMDDQMPKKSGTEATKEILLYEIGNAMEHTPIVAISANVVRSYKEHKRRSIYDAFLGKPLNLKELEAVFEKYCTLDIPEESSRPLDMQQLKSEMMLDDEQLQMLLKVFISKMDNIMPKLYEAIENYHLADIAKYAHSIRGSSANFRILTIQEFSAAMEEAAIKEDKNYHYRVDAKAIEKEYRKIVLK
jgi:CheY-like chemotaxis protein